jgi:alkanesulfonate monooxygenase SsuD/methylene tetrahydromethanopterin reductase-like flavin-dependent oxidoreductase (luciferase family)
MSTRTRKEDTAEMNADPQYGLVLCSQFLPGEDAAARFEEQLEQVRFARDTGFSSVWATQHYLADPFQYLHPLAVLSRIVPESGDMRIGTAITLMALGNPVDLAEELATLDIISGGRLTVGAGLGYRDVEFDAFGVPRSGRLRRFLDNLDVVRRLWTEEEVTFSNDAVKLDGVRPVLRPVQRPHPPLWLAGHTDSALRRTARMGFPWIAAAAHVEKDYLYQQVGTYRDACAEAGNGPGEVHVLQEIYVGDNDEQAIEDVRTAMTVKYDAYRAWGQDRVLPPSQSFDAEFDKLRKGRFILGGPASCRAQLAELTERVGPGNILLRPQWPGMPQQQVMASLERLTDEVLR